MNTLYDDYKWLAERAHTIRNAKWNAKERHFSWIHWEEIFKKTKEDEARFESMAVDNATDGKEATL